MGSPKTIVKMAGSGEMQQVFTVRFGQEVEEDQVTVGKFDGKNYAMAW